jgi:polyhydroxyalkanoate synthesis regulator phasin
VIEMATTLDQVREYMEAAIGKLSPAKAQDLAKSLTKGQGRDQVSKTAKDLMAWSKKNRERLSTMVQTEVRSQLKTIGVASRDEVDALRKRVRELERAEGKSTRKRSTAKRSTAKRSTAKRSTSAPATPAPPSETS